MNLSVQEQWLRKWWPGHSWISKSTLTWIGVLTPSPASVTYTIKLTYKLQDYPRVTVVSPILDRRGAELLPHTFPGDELCLFYGHDWDEETPIAKTIIPWASEWLYHYEIWLFTGEWMGGGIHPHVKTRLRNQIHDGVRGIPG